ncbi:STAS domain-containing protein [Streptomyces sp. NPDC049915]|uniref:STAS domain-containing protein n=1 Tax=Streptomyces sp. NPDC049915 TaxID=3155510 RepID=UPI00343D42C6
MVVTVAGEVDHRTASGLGEELETAAAGGARQVEVDFSLVGCCDCAGLNVLLAARIHCQDRGVGLPVSGLVMPAIARLFQLTGAGSLLLMPQAA